MTPTVGRVVIFMQSERELPTNGTREHPAIITRVWTDDCINLKVFFDAGETANVTSVQRRGVAPEDEMSWDWPPRV